MADDVLIRLLMEASQFLQEGDKATAAFDRLTAAAEHIEREGTDAEVVLGSLDEAVRRVGDDASRAGGQFSGLGDESTGLRGKFQGILDTGFKLQGTFEAIRSAIILVVQGMKFATDIASLNVEASEKLAGAWKFVVGEGTALEATLLANAAAGRLYEAAVADATAEIERQQSVLESFRSELGLDRREILQTAGDLERLREEAGDNEIAIQAVAERAAEFRERLEGLGQSVPQVVIEISNLNKETDELSAVEEHHAEILDQEAEKVKALADEIEKLAAEAEGLKALQEELIKLGDQAVAQSERAQKALEEAFADPDQKETQAFQDRQKQLEDLQRQLEEIQETGSKAFLADPAALEAERVLLEQIRELEGQRITQFEEVAQSAEEASRRQAEAQSVVTEVIDGSRASLQSLTDRFPQLDAASRATLEGIISNFETEITLTDNLAAATTRFGEEFSTALSQAEEKAAVAFDLIERGAEDAATAQEKLKGETEGLGEETERAAESAGVLNIQMGEAITKYGNATTEASQLKDVSADIRDLWGEIGSLI